MGHAEREGLRRSHDHQELPGRVQQESGDRCCQGRQLADTSCRKSRKPKARNRRKSSVGGSEELADTVGGRCQQRQPVRQADEDACVVDQGKRHEAEPELGGTADGAAGGLDTTPGPLVNRVDRLRLLGNGVVNQTAAKAFATLSGRLDKHLK